MLTGRIGDNGELICFDDPHIMPNHIFFYRCEHKLPENNSYVLAHLVKDNWHDIDDEHGNRYWVVVKFVMGLSKKERDSMDDSEERKHVWCSEDEHDNNLKPYGWEEFGPSSYFGQEVDVWAYLPRYDKINHVNEGYNLRRIEQEKEIQKIRDERIREEIKEYQRLKEKYGD